MEEIHITIIGAGAVGCAIAYELSRYFSDEKSREIVVVEKNEQINGENQSSRNSGVIHAGIYYPKDFGPLKSKFCVEGNNLLYNFCSKYDVPCRKTGKLVVAVNKLEEEYLEDVYRIAVENQVSGVRYLSKEEIKKFEPNVEGISALYVPASGIVEPTCLVSRFYKIAEENGAIFLEGSRVVEVEPECDFSYIGIKTRTGTERFRTRFLINSAGLYSDEVAKMINPESPYEMEPVKGEWAKFYSTRRPDIMINGLNVYPVPAGYTPDGVKLSISLKEFNKLFKENKITRSVGVHLSPTFSLDRGRHVIGDTIIVGPAYSRPKDKEDYAHSKNEKTLLDAVISFFPNLRIEDISLHQTGIRAKLKNHYDFVIESDRKYTHCVNLVGIDSPGLTSCLSIARYVKEIIKEQS
ncbi:MAG: NAD(P)/FAD-dependent oxidoreductase [Actinobacteria bacterium]|nr:NAD(P)/FAD-dependent oxidoreductase [Actinomycetota bacterium]MBM3713185.1 NAD(P)/FAD-dependent oxidoreductase [Actinomycetota bacterium]